jgi:UDP-2-acetamido-3-amino-2,3-dideoxy-glucuronate N-acetyltransferase
VIVGDKKMAVFDDTIKEGKLKVHDEGVDWVDRKPVPRKNKPQIVQLESYEPLKEECRHFLESIKTGERPKTDEIEGIRVLKVLNACQQSLETQGSIINLNGDGNGQTFFTHETAVIESPSTIGKGTRIWHFSHVMPDSRIGEGCNIGQNVVIAPGVRIGNNVKIQNNVSVYKGVILEDDVFCGPSMVFTNVINPRSRISRKNEYRQTIVKKGASIGANATIVCGHEIGKHSFIGAGAVVTKDVPDYALMLGNPAKISGWMCECGHRIEFYEQTATCTECCKRYVNTGNSVRPWSGQVMVSRAVTAA